MKYYELYDEYITLLYRQADARQKLQLLPKGYITIKKISGKEYHYLQYTSFGKKRTEYLRGTEIDSIRKKLALRASLCKEIEKIHTTLDKLERAAKILDEQLNRSFFHLRQCADMDALPISKRDKALSFARAMTALEGLPARETTEENLKLWAKGEKSFADFYLPALQNYGAMEASR